MVNLSHNRHDVSPTPGPSLGHEKSLLIVCVDEWHGKRRHDFSFHSGTGGEALIFLSYTRKFPIFRGRPLSKTIIIFKRLLSVTAINFYTRSQQEKVFHFWAKGIVILIIFNPLSVSFRHRKKNFLFPSPWRSTYLLIIYLPLGRERFWVPISDVCFFNLSLELGIWWCGSVHKQNWYRLFASKGLPPSSWWSFIKICQTSRASLNYDLLSIQPPAQRCRTQNISE